MKIFDISIPISTDMPVWPGDPGVMITKSSSLEEGENANVSHLSLGVHTGTHVDAPLHFLIDGESLDKIPLERFVGDAQVFEVPAADLVTAGILSNLNLTIKADRVLFKTKNSGIWESEVKAFKEDFVAFTPDAAEFLVNQGVSLVGIDYLSIAPFGDSTPTHKIFLEAGVVLLEGIDLSGVSPGEYTLFCLPLKIQGVEGAPVRAILVEK